MVGEVLKILISLPRFYKQLIAVLLDVFLVVLAVWLAYSIRLEKLHIPLRESFLVYLLPVFIALPIFIKMGLYRAVFRYTGQHALWSITVAVSIYGVIFFQLVFFWNLLFIPGQDLLPPLSIGVLQPLILLILIVISRSAARILLMGGFSRGVIIQQRILIFGAGIQGIQIAKSLQRSKRFYLIGYLDDDPNLRHKIIDGLTVYAVNEVEALISRYGVTDILLALSPEQQSHRSEILNKLQKLRVHVRSLPSPTDLAEGKFNISDIRELDIEDLLQRSPVQPNVKLLESAVRNKVIMVTGAGGSIGAELSRQILICRPKILILLEQSEFALYALEIELREKIKSEAFDTELISLLGNVRDSVWVKKICNTWRINAIYHAAAYKHVPIVEKNVIEGLLNNVWGTLNMAKVAIENGVDQFVLISTDKAVRPTNVMGASKRLAEMILQALGNELNVCTRFSIVRFGNVLGSSGSVVPLFRDQINAGGPITLTHPDVTRYFMTIPEAAQLVIQAGAMTGLSESADQATVFVLDMGEPVKIIDLAKRMIELSGFSLKDDLNPDGDIAIEVVGLRPGEKLYEELLIGDDPKTTSHPRIMKAQEVFIPWGELEIELFCLHQSILAADIESVYQQLVKLINGFCPDSDIVDWIFSY